jgi:hypothetical protein
MLGDVGQRLGDDEVRHRLDLVGQSVRQIDVQRRWHPGSFGALHHRGQCCVEASVGQDGRRDAAHDVAQLDQRALGVVVGLGDERAGGGQIRVEFRLRQADRHGQ